MNLQTPHIFRFAGEFFVRTRAAGVYVAVEYGGIPVTETAGICRTLQAQQIPLPMLDRTSTVDDIWLSPAWRTICNGIRTVFGEDGRNHVRGGTVLRGGPGADDWRAVICILWSHAPDRSRLWYHSLERRAFDSIERAVTELVQRAEAHHRSPAPR